MANLNLPMAEYFPSTFQGAPLDDDTLFWELFEGEPLAVDGHATLPSKPGLGLDLNIDCVRHWTVQ
jgi:L-alanine-DL-glutamate epimerase-like enolase superfamily enzyme